MVFTAKDHDRFIFSCITAYGKNSFHYGHQKKNLRIIFFYDERLIFVNFYALRLNFSAVSRLMVDPIETLPVTEAGLYRQSNRHIGYLIKYSLFRQRLSRHFNFVFSLVFVYIIFIVA